MSPQRPRDAPVTIVTIADRPDLVPTVTQWLWREFWSLDGYPIEATRAVVAASIARSGPPQTFVALMQDQPVGTASLAAEDLDERPDLSPWLAGVFVIPQARRHGHASRLVSAVETACRAASIPAAWLYTHTAEGLYARAGWQAVEVVHRRAKPSVTLMRKDLVRRGAA